MITVKKCTQEDINILKPNLDSRDKKDVLDVLGITAQENLQKSYQACWDCYCVRDNKYVYAVFGIFAQPNGLKMNGYLFLIRSKRMNELAKHREFNTVLARGFVDNMKMNYHTLSCAIRREKWLVRWMKHLGFKRDREITVNGQELYYYIMEEEE